MRLLIALLLVLIAVPSWAQTYETMQMIRPVATGAAGTGLDASNRVYRAYQGIEYNIHADARGGKWPYTYSLSGAPSGMSIESGPCTVIGPTCTAGTITWTPGSSGTFGPITVRATDSLGTYVEGVWSITVSTTIGADGFCFVDVNNSAGGRNGSLANPYNSLLEVYNSCGARSILYLRGGTYLPTTDLAGVCSGATEYGCGASFAESARPNIWIGYPGETAIIDYASTGSNVAVYINSQGRNTWVDNLTLKNIGNHGWRFNIRNSYGIVARRITAYDLMDGEDGNNSAFFMWTGAAYPDQSYFDTVQNSTFTGIYGDGSGIDGASELKVYGTQYAVIETSTYDGSAFPEGVIALKSGATRTTVRANICGITTAVKSCIGGNMNTDSNSEPLSATGLEAYHNLLKSNASGNNDGNITLVEGFINDTFDFSIYRNTLIGQLLVKHYTGMAGSGNYTFYDNVIVNSGATGGSCPLQATCVLYSGSWDYSHWVDNGDNLMGLNDGSIVSSTTGQLTAGYAAYLGTTGFELGSGGGGSSGTRFTPAINLRRSEVEILRDDLVAFQTEQAARWTRVCAVLGRTRTTWAANMRREIPC